LETSAILVKLALLLCGKIAIVNQKRKGNRVSPATAPRAIVKDANERLHELLSRVPFIQVSKPQGGTGSREEGELFPMDGFLQVRTANSSWWLLLDVKSHAQMRDARQGLDYLKRYAQAVGKPAYPIFASQYLSPSIRSFCVENGIGYFDFSGNCRLVFDQVFIEREVPASETPERKRLRSLFSLKSSRVMRRLLSDPHRLWKVQLLAEEADVSAATVSLMKDKLLGEEYASRQGEGFIITKPEQLLEDWARNYDARQHKQIECYGSAELGELESSFARHCWERSINYAFTLFSGAKRVAPFTRGIQRGYAYVSSAHNLDEIMAALKWKPVDSGGNFRLMTPIDDDVLWGKHEVEGDCVVSDIQLYLDLASNRGRGEENAEYLLEQRIRPRW